MRVGKNNEPFVTPGKTKKKKRVIRDIDDVTKSQIRDVIYEFCMNREYNSNTRFNTHSNQ